MNNYEEYLEEKLRQAEANIEDLYYQLSLEQQENAKNGILLREIQKRLKQKGKSKLCVIAVGKCNNCKCCWRQLSILQVRGLINHK